MRKSYEIIGYADTEHGYCVCNDCVTEKEIERCHPIFLGDEFDEPPTCDRCFKKIDGEEQS